MRSVPEWSHSGVYALLGLQIGSSLHPYMGDRDREQLSGSFLIKTLTLS